MRSEDLDLVWREMARIGTCMMVTRAGAGLRSRPMMGSADRAANRIYFIANRTQHKDDEIAADSHVCLAYADLAGNTFVSVSGRARVADDPVRLRALWSPKIAAWFKDGPDDPDAILLEVTPEEAEIWDNFTADILVALKTLTAREDDPPRT